MMFSQAQMSTMFIPLPPLISSKSHPLSQWRNIQVISYLAFPHSLLWTEEETNHRANSSYQIHSWSLKAREAAFCL